MLAPTTAYDSEPAAPATARATRFQRAERLWDERFRLGACGLVALMSVSVLAGWAFHVTALKSVMPGLTSMKANTAIGLLLVACGLEACGLVLLDGGRYRMVANAAGVLVAALGAITLIEYLFGVSLRIDEMLFADPMSTSAPFNGRMSPVTAACLLCLGGAVLLLGQPSGRGVILAHGLALPVGAMGLLSLTGYFYGVERLYNFGAYVSTALHTAAALCVLATATLLTRPDEGWRAPLAGSPAARAVFARLLPWSLILPFMTGLLVLAGVRAGFYQTLFAPALFSVATSGAFLWLTFLTTGAARRTEAALAASEMRFRQLAETMPSMVFMTDASGRCTYANSTFQQFSGLPAQALMAEGWLNALLPNHREFAADGWRNSVQAGKPFEMEYQFRRADGRAVHHLGRSLPLRNATGEVTGWFGTFTDIQDLIDDRQKLVQTNTELEQILATYTAQLRQLQKSDTLGTLTTGLAHDFNNLLTPIMGSLELVQRRVGDDDRSQRHLQTALLAAQRASGLVQRLLALSRHQAPQTQLADVGQLVQGLAELVRRSVGETADVALEVDADLPPVRVDAHQLELAILNLAINGRDAMPQGGSLLIRARRARATETLPKPLPGSDYLCVSVADTGMGMDQETLRRAAEPFFSTKDVGKGTGLGLWMAHGLAAQSGGMLTLRSTLGAGTTAELWLPCDAAAA